MISSLKIPSFEKPIPAGRGCAPPCGPGPANSPPVLATFLFSGSKVLQKQTF